MNWLSLAIAAVCLVAMSAFLVRARLLGDEGTGFPTASFRTLALLDLGAAGLAAVGVPAIFGHLVLPPWAAALAIGAAVYGIHQLVVLARARAQLLGRGHRR
jgi:hypothetical protein